MKFLFALAFLAVVCAIPRPEQITETQNELEQSEPSQGSGNEHNQVGDAKNPNHGKQIEDADESNEDYDDKDDSGKEKSLEDLINALNSIKDALKKKIKDKGHNKIEESENDIYVPTNRVSVYSLDTATDAPQGNKSESKESSSDQNNENETVSDHKPSINITIIKKEIHDKIENMILNILRPWLGNNSVDGNSTVANANITEPPQAFSNETRGNSNGDKGVGKDTVTVAPQPGNNSIPPPNDSASNKTEGESTSESQVVNTYTTETVSTTTKAVSTTTKAVPA